MSTLAHYLSEIRKVRSLGAVPETAYYPALAELFNTIGMGLQPRVSCIVHPAGQGAGIPDLALFSKDQIPSNGEPLIGVLPSRGVIEAKGAGADLERTANSRQVGKYLEKYRQVLVTNLREFVLVVCDENGKPQQKDRFSLATSEAAFWNSSETNDSRHVLFADFIKRCLVSNAPITTPKDLAWLLASYAREALGRVEGSNLNALLQLRTGLEEALGITFTGERGDRFFRSTLVQTLFYGVFSAWVLWHERGGKGRFDWKTASYELRVPMIRSLFYQAADPQHLEPLGLVEILNWAGDALGRVDREVFFARFAVDNAVQYFYEPFLEAFDPELRKELGVWYTPREIVRYQVARVDKALREELGIADGLADPDVIVLDPCCGTGAYLVETVRLILGRLTANGTDMLALAEVKKAVMERLYGFEILPAPFVVAHLQMGLILQSIGMPFSGVGNERAGIYLTNALTGWEGDPPQKAMIFPELATERDAASKVKRSAKVLVVLGNPPYNGYADVAVSEERSLSDAYRTTKNVPMPQGHGLNDLYVRFFRMAERRIVEQTGRGVVCFISNYSWLDGLSFPGMRERYAEVFDKVWIDNCNGDRYRTGKMTPDGKPDPSVFSTPYNRQGIQVGTGIATLVRKSEHSDGAEIYYREFWGKSKLAEIDNAKDGISGPEYIVLNPPLSIGLPFSMATAGGDYLTWVLLPNLFPDSFPGVKTSRDDIVIDIDRDALETRMRMYFDPAVSHEHIRQIMPGVMENTAGFAAERVRSQLQRRGFLPSNIVPYRYRPFDDRWIYWEPETKLLDRNRPEYFLNVFGGNSFLFTTGRTRKNTIESPIMPSRLMDLNCMDSGARGFPMKLKKAPATSLFDDASNSDHAEGVNWNLSNISQDYLSKLEAPPDLLFFHAFAVMHSSAYREEHSGALRQDWPRIPLPDKRSVLESSASLGHKIAALLDTETPVIGVTTGAIFDIFKNIALLSRDGGGGLVDGDLAVTAGWGTATTTGVMPGQGQWYSRVADPGTPTILGAETFDIYLNASLAWRNVPAAVWSYTLGGYQVMKKWLSYREKGVLGRDLTMDEAREVQRMARRIAAILLLGPTLDENYRTTKGNTFTVTGHD